MEREQAIQEVMAETGESYEVVASVWDAVTSMEEEERLELRDAVSSQLAEDFLQ